MVLSFAVAPTALSLGLSMWRILINVLNGNRGVLQLRGRVAVYPQVLNQSITGAREVGSGL